MNNLLETIDLEVRIAAASSVREHLQVAAEQKNPHEVELCVIDGLTDALITLRTEQIEAIWLPRKAA